MWFWIIIIFVGLAFFGAIYDGFNRPFELDNIKHTRQNTEKLADNQRLKELEKEKEILELKKEIEQLKNK